MSNYGIKISKPGYDIDNASLINQIFNSQKNCIKLSQIAGTVNSTLSASGGSETHEINHGFSFTPGFLVWFQIDGSGEWYFMYTSGNLIDYINCNPYTNDSKLYIPLVNNDDAQHTVVAHYVVFADKGG